MSAMTNFTLRSLRANKVRTFVTIAGVALAAALIAAVLTTYTSLADFLYRGESETSGTWMSYVDSEDSPLTKKEVSRAESDPGVSGVAVLSDVGFGKLDKNQQKHLGMYLPILSASGDIQNVTAIRPSEGRLPQNPNEIMLYAGWQEYEGTQIGDILSIEVGQREAVLTPGKEKEDENYHPTTFDTDSASYDIVDGMRLSSALGYFGADDDGDVFTEKLVDLSSKTYTVVGFYDRMSYALSVNAGACGITTGDTKDTDFTKIYMTFSGVSNSAQVEERTKALFPDNRMMLHIAMLRYMGISSDRSIWDTFFGLVVVLALVVAVACVSLIFNAFNISVAERMNQFGLLSSIGASRRQLRRAVVLEGLLIAAIGIPFGILIGLGGCAITFAFLGPGISDLMGGEVPFSVAVNGWALGIATVLTLVTVLISVWIPAKRASLTNIIDALRHTGSARISKRGIREAEGNSKTSKLWARRGMAGRIFGVGGVLARINRKRGATKGRAASASLAVAVVLLLTAGSLNTFLGQLVNAVGGDGTQAGEVSVTAQFFRDSEESYDEAKMLLKEMRDEEASGKDQSNKAGISNTLTPEQLLKSNGETFSEQLKIFSDAYKELSGIENSDALGWVLSTEVPMEIPAEMAGSALGTSNELYAGKLENGNFGATVTIEYIDDGSFDAYAKRLGLDPDAFRDQDRACAIGLDTAYGNNGVMYQVLDLMKEPGVASVPVASVYEHRMPASIEFDFISKDDGPFSRFTPYIKTSEGSSFLSDSVSNDDVETLWEPFEVLAITDEMPEVSSNANGQLCFVLPLSEAYRYSFGQEFPWFKAFFNSTDGDHATLLEALSTVGGAFFADYGAGTEFAKKNGFEIDFYSYNDYIEEMSSTQMLATIVNVFCMLFTVILTLIAMANVFNTVTNSLILRRREFAVMRSVGLSNKQFRRMIMDECANFGIAGLVPGLIASVFVSFLLYYAVTRSLGGLAFAVPWPYIVAAIAMTAAAMGIAVAYGMHRCKADNVVEALRADNV